MPGALEWVFAKRIPVGITVEKKDCPSLSLSLPLVNRSSDSIIPTYSLWRPACYRVPHVKRTNYSNQLKHPIDNEPECE